MGLVIKGAYISHRKEVLLSIYCSSMSERHAKMRIFVASVRPLSVDSWDGGFFTRVLAAVGR